MGNSGVATALRCGGGISEFGEEQPASNSASEMALPIAAAFKAPTLPSSSSEFEV
jgi:hypothetical protein